MAELLASILLLIQQYGLLGVVIAAVVVIAIMFSRTWTRQQDSKTESENARTDIIGNANKAQEIINDRVLKLEQDSIAKDARITGLEVELTSTKETLSKARRRIARLTHQLEDQDKEKVMLGQERDRLRTDLDTANRNIHDLEIEVTKLNERLAAREDMRSTILELLRPPPPPETKEVTNA